MSNLSLNIVLTRYIVYDDICLMVRKINYFIIIFIIIILFLEYPLLGRVRHILFKNFKYEPVIFSF
jgi:hypothetical protein